MAKWLRHDLNKIGTNRRRLFKKSCPWDPHRSHAQLHCYDQEYDWPAVAGWISAKQTKYLTNFTQTCSTTGGPVIFGFQPRKLYWSQGWQKWLDKNAQFGSYTENLVASSKTCSMEDTRGTTRRFLGPGQTLCCSQICLCQSSRMGTVDSTAVASYQVFLPRAL